LKSPTGWHRSLNQQIEFLLEESLSGAAKKPQGRAAMGQGQSREILTEVRHGTAKFFDF
jgi:hypothetical protein